MSQYTKDLAALNATGNGAQPISLANRGTKTGMNGDTYGADVSVDATNPMGRLTDTASDMAEENCPGEC